MTFRSLDMLHYSLIIPTPNSYSTISSILSLHSAHFLDQGNPTHRHHHSQIKRLQQLTLYTSMMRNAAKLAGYTPQQYDDAERGFVEGLIRVWEQEAAKLGVEDVKLLDYYERDIGEEYRRYREVLDRLEKLKLRKKDLLEKIAVDETIASFFEGSSLQKQSNEYYQNYMGEGLESVSGISYIVGVIDRQSQARFNKIIYRVSRGYACTRSLELFKFPALRDFASKVVMVIYPSSTSAVLEKKIQKVIQMFCNSVTELNKEHMRMQQRSNAKVEAEFTEIENYISMNQAELKAFFKHICEIGNLQKWSLFIWKQKCIYETLNKLQIRGQFTLGNIYIPKDKIKELSLQLNKIVPSPTLQQLAVGTPPTAFSTNAYTSIAQQITDTYGVPRYKEMNPSIFTTITFPFFFGVMFGDIGHGAVLFVLGLYLILNDGWLSKHPIGKMFSRLRYMVTLMGFFAFYCGWVYNDLIGFNYNFFGSCYDPRKVMNGRVYPKQDCVYPFGIDPIWGIAENQLVYVNSLKMKISVIIAIVHMTFGILVKAMNSLYFRKKLDFYFQFLPQIIFMVILFGYMDFLIIFKWLQPWDASPDPLVPARQWAPSIISTMMGIGLSMGKTGTKPDGNSNMWGPLGDTWQDTLQLSILGLAFLCIPTMLLPKPLIMISKLKKSKTYPQRDNTSMIETIESDQSLERSLLNSQNKQLDSNLYSSDSEAEDNPPRAKHSEHSHDAHGDAGEIFVHQLIETIQFALGAVSNTASYLRLWALSLAHSQLANVFFQKTLKNTIQLKGLISAAPNVAGFWMLCWITFGVLMCMDTMECFLHSLRLHWVEFQNKFYKGDGYRYQPASFRSYLQLQRNEENK